MAERGRSLGVILIGAEQTASEVERRVIANSAIRVVGRLDSAEAARPEYGFLPAAHRQRATIAKPGTMFVSQPEIPGAARRRVPVPGLGDAARRTGSAIFRGHARRPVHRLSRPRSMKFLHTSDWHVGKLLKGASRLEEHRRVLAEIADVARREAVDLIVVAGDVYESAAPTADAQAVAWRALLDLRDTGAKVVVIAGNHDNAHQFDALRPVMAELDITMLGLPVRPEAGGVIEVAGRAGDRACLALLPFCSQRYVVRAAELMTGDAAPMPEATPSACRRSCTR